MPEIDIFNDGNSPRPAMPESEGTTKILSLFRSVISNGQLSVLSSGGGGGGGDVQYANGAAIVTPIGNAVLGYDGTFVRILSTDSSGKLNILQGDLNQSIDSVSAFLKDGSGNQTGIVSNPLRVDPTGTTAQPITVTSLPLPNNAAQETGGHLSSLDTKVPSQGQAVAANSLPVVLPVSQITALTPPTTVIVTQSTGSNLHVNVDNFPTTQPVSGSISISNFPATQPVSGSISVSNFPATQAISAVSLPLPTGASTSAKQPAFGIAGTAASDVLSVQGLSGMTPLKVDGSGVTQPISGSVSISNFPTTQPISGSVSISNFPATQAISAVSLPLPTGAATSAKQPALGVAGTPSTDVITVQGAASGIALPIAGTVISKLEDGSGNPITSTSSALDVNIKSGAAGGVSVIDEAAFTAGTSVFVPNGGVFNDTVAALTSGQQGTFRATANRGLHTNIRNAAGTELATSANPIRTDPTGTTTQPVSGTVTDNQGTPNTTANAWPIKVTDGTNVGAVKAASTAAAATDPSFVVQLSPNQPALTTPFGIQGVKSNNNAAPGASNSGVLSALANAAVPAWTEGNQVLESVDLNGSLRTVLRPPVILGSYRVAAQTAAYTALSAGAILYSFRWTDATKVCVITRVRILVNTTTPAAAAGMLDRDLVIVRGFTAADTGGTAITLTGNNQKLRTSQATTVVGGINISSGGALTAGTGTADAQAIGLIGKQGAAAEPTGLTIPPEDLFAYNIGQNYPIFLASNEGFRIRIPTAMPTTIAMRTTVTVEWAEIAAAGQF